jgi:CheY-like chemotaxis protein
MKVLIIDDEPLIRRSLSRAFKSQSHDTQEAEDGLVGLQIWLEWQPDLVFLDVLMPHMSGPQVLEEMKRLRPEFATKVILMSAFSGIHNMESALQMGAKLFISKPFEDIFQIVNKAVNL